MEVAGNQCPNCRHSFKTLADEFGTHECPKCGFSPAQEIEEEKEVICFELTINDTCSGEKAAQVLSDLEEVIARHDLYLDSADWDYI